MATAKRTSVLPYHYVTQITAALAKLCGAALNKSALMLTKDEFLEAFIRPEHLDKLREVYDMVGADGSPGGVTPQIGTNPADASERLFATMHYFRSPGIIVPKYIESSMNPGTPATQKVIAWAAERRRMGLVLGDAFDAIHSLNHLCGNGRALSLMFPAIGAIMVRSCPLENVTQETIDKDPVVKMGRKIDQGKSVGDLPRLPREVVERIRMASATVHALLLTEDAPKPVAKDALVILRGLRFDNPQVSNPIYQRPSIIGDGTTTTFI